METAYTDFESEGVYSLKARDNDEDENSVFFFKVPYYGIKSNEQNTVPYKKKDDGNGVVVDIEAKGELESIASSPGVERIEIFAWFYS
jgi:hypothetical protein